MGYKLIDVAIIIFLLFGSIVVINFLLEFKKDSGKCLNNPFVYGSMKLEKDQHQRVYGTIFIENKGTMYFNSTNMMAGERWQSLTG